MARVIWAAMTAVVLVTYSWVVPAETYNVSREGIHFPGDFFMGEELGREKDGTVIAAVHLGHHHRTDGAVLVITALLLSRIGVRAGSMRTVVFAAIGSLLAYGGVNFVQDAWNEQLYKRGSTDLSIPSAILPGLRPIWIVVIGLAVLATVVLLREEKSYSAR